MVLLFIGRSVYMSMPRRKRSRLANYDYGMPGAYFVTFCTKNREILLWENVGASIARPEDVPLSECGKITKQAIENIAKHYPGVFVDHYAIMPNHVHILLRIVAGENGRPIVAPTVSTVVQQMKGWITKQIGIPIWQKLFHDHVIRGREDYQGIWNYIDGNPMRWTDDCFYCE